MRPVYGLYPSSGLVAARARFGAYAISELHDGLGRPEFTAVLKPDHRVGGLAPLLRAPTLEGLCARLSAQPQAVAAVGGAGPDVA